MALLIGGVDLTPVCGVVEWERLCWDKPFGHQTIQPQQLLSFNQDNSWGILLNDHVFNTNLCLRRWSDKDISSLNAME